jgi:hypothetical protein
MIRRLQLSLFLILSVLTSCEKQEKPVSLPEKSSSQHSPTIAMGEQYLTQLFFDFETNSVVYTSEVNSWDLAFEPSGLGYHVFINGNKNYLYNTHETDFGKCITTPAIKASEWKADAHCGLPDSTAIGEWKNGTSSKKEVYIIKSDSTATGIFRKVQILSVSTTEYVIAVGNIEDAAPRIITIPKDEQYSFSYFSFNNGIVYPEPPKNTWDIVFTRYAYLFSGSNLPPYRLTGVLFNPYQTSGVLDTIVGYNNIDINTIGQVKFSRDRDVIGYDWKLFDFSNPYTSEYIIDKKKSYIIYTRKDQYYKMHFIAFLSPDGKRGYPTFEFERLH